MWGRGKGKAPPVDSLREFAYLDETRVVSLLAALQGAIPETVTESSGRSRDRGLAVKSGLEGVAAAEARLGSTTSSGTETLRRAVAQSTFRELWRRDQGVILHDPTSFGAELGTPIREPEELDSRIELLVESRAAARVSDLVRGSVIEVGWEVRPDEIHQTMTAAKTLFDMISGRERLFNVDSAEFANFGPIFEVLAEFSVGLVPIRGACSTHYLYEVGGERYLVDARVFDASGPVVATSAELEIVSFTDVGGYWRDPRTTLMSGFDCTAYLRIAESGLLQGPWNPLKLADVLGALGPNMRTEAITALDFLRHPQVAQQPEPVHVDARPIVEAFAKSVSSQTPTSNGATVPPEVIERAADDLVHAESLLDRRRALDQVVDAIPGASDLEREQVRQLRDSALQLPVPVAAESPPNVAPTPQESAIAQLEVAVIALYW